MRFKNVIKIKDLLKVNSVLILFCVCVYFLKLDQSVMDYIMIQNESEGFKDLLTILITFFVAMFGLVVTVCSIFISMTNKHIFNLLRRFKQTQHFINKIKISLITTIIINVLLSIIYCNFDFSFAWLRIVIIYFIVITTYIFIKHLSSLINILLDLLYREIQGE